VWLHGDEALEGLADGVEPNRGLSRLVTQTRLDVAAVELLDDLAVEILGQWRRHEGLL
jgi:hypothetical protein